MTDYWGSNPDRTSSTDFLGDFWGRFKVPKKHPLVELLKNGIESTLNRDSGIIEILNCILFVNQFICGLLKFMTRNLINVN